MRANVRTFYAWIGSLILLGASPILAAWLIRQQTLATRIAGVAVGVGGMLPWMWIVAMMIRRGDEYVRRIHLVALSCAFGGTLVLVMALALLRRAHFIGPPDLMVLWLALLIIWIIAFFFARRHYERSV